MIIKGGVFTCDRCGKEIDMNKNPNLHMFEVKWYEPEEMAFDICVECMNGVITQEMINKKVEARDFVSDWFPFR